MDVMDWWIRLLLALLWFFLAGTSASEPPAASGANTVRSPVLVESVDVLVMESFPMQLSLIVKGQHPDGCDLPVVVEQRREGNTVIVELYRNLPIDLMCAMVVVPYEGTIPLEGGFEPGRYTIIVNDFVVQQEL